MTDKEVIAFRAYQDALAVALQEYNQACEAALIAYRRENDSAKNHSIEDIDWQKQAKSENDHIYFLLNRTQIAAERSQLRKVYESKIAIRWCLYRQRCRAKKMYKKGFLYVPYQ